MARYVCSNCRYRFESREEEWKKKCPYCNTWGIDPEPDADSLLENLGE